MSVRLKCCDELLALLRLEPRHNLKRPGNLDLYCNAQSDVSVVRCGISIWKVSVMIMKTYPGSLFLYEEILLLALRDGEGTMPLGTMYEYAVGGALLAELSLSGRIRLDSSRRKFVH